MPPWKNIGIWWNHCQCFAVTRSTSYQWYPAPGGAESNSSDSSPLITPFAWVSEPPGPLVSFQEGRRLIWQALHWNYTSTDADTDTGGCLCCGVMTKKSAKLVGHGNAKRGMVTYRGMVGMDHMYRSRVANVGLRLC